jgi:hypothetical protein
VSFHDDEAMSESDKATLEALFNYVEAQGWCPMPDPWGRLWEMLLTRQRECEPPRPAPPLILAAWHEAPPLMKRVRLLDQLESAAEYGILDEVDQYLRGLREEDWFQGDVMPQKAGSKANELKARLAAAIAAVTDCAAQILTEASSLQEQLKSSRVPEPLAGDAQALALSLDAEAVGTLGVLKELRSATQSGYLNGAEVQRVLTEIDARLVAALAGLVELSGRLEKAAETDERLEPVFVLVIEAASRLLEGFQLAQAATRALRDAMPRRGDDAPPVRRASDGNLVVLEVGAEGGSLTLIGREGEGGAWRFARVTDDQSEALFGEVDVPITAPDLTSLVWVDGWEAGLSLMDRYPWVRLSPQYVHPEFMERVKTALEERLASVDAGTAEDVRERWERGFARNAPLSRQR